MPKLTAREEKKARTHNDIVVGGSRDLEPKLAALFLKIKRRAPKAKAKK